MYNEKNGEGICANICIYTVFKNRCPVEKIERRSLDRKGTWDGLKGTLQSVLRMTVGLFISGPPQNIRRLVHAACKLL